ncbi:MAG: 1-acyl-sn-glycerol-3-phosphate acyltransferase [Alphaproteobacteria bacterium]|nr:1-acyl-sn-glycerol-3-phosphate acyltransferase [Alphaproteobacteria bacterium]MDE1985509.1 1-acyl-sn-glycerol-3-phosphate acyltransferase [Alphaproteobacteria bacterium]MDE2161602.1 1-acyl-sn-glycerol-3-phosphate acyltransferase [Alphaproteobacteria bacterium]MDE2267190.1 1-acyl-sn-glycerol-3-phosphate acyltransferase [Alphaproteobacteria bacterium]MDE2499726.1 1-acyl-sn-glycerol-3-phosphate acyltransferase [Alphaproteobacteria bacterium]
MPQLRAIVVLVIFLILTLASMPWQFLAVRFKLQQRRTFPNRFHKLLCRLFDIRVTVIGKPIQDRGVLMVANHTSYLDILILSATARVSFIGRRDVSTWPLFGTLTRLQETVYVDREKRARTGEARDIIRDRLHDGDALVLFPEGTSTDGNRVVAFKSALMGATEAEVGTDAAGRPQYVPVQPVSISYVGIHGMPMGREDRPLYAWYGDMELLPHLWEMLAAGPLDVVVEYHAPITVDGVGGRKKISALAETTIRSGLRRALAGGRQVANGPTSDNVSVESAA